MAVLAQDAGHELADLHIRLDGVDVDDIVRAGFVGFETGAEGEVDMQAVGVAAHEVHYGQRTLGDEQGGIVDMYLAVVVHEMVFVQPREIVGLGHAVAVGLFGEPALQDGAEKGGGLLPRLEECPLAHLGLGLAVVILRRQLSRIGAAETGVVYLAADGAGVFDEGWFDFCHDAYRCCMLPVT